MPVGRGSPASVFGGGGVISIECRVEQFLRRDCFVPESLFRGQNESEAMDDQQMPGKPKRDDATKTAGDTTVEQARTMARNAGEQVWSAAADAGATAQNLARR